MRKPKYILLFLTAISLSLIVMGVVYNLVSGKPAENNIAKLFMLNLPFCVMLGLADLAIIRFTYRKTEKFNDIQRFIIDLLSTTILGVFVTAVLNYALTLELSSLRSALPVIPWNIIVVLLIEVFQAHLREMEMSKDKARYQFQLLKNQMNPHFLFNSLNVIASLAYEDAEKTNRFAKKLSSVYRYLLSTYERQTVSVTEEIAFLKSYLYLEKIRFGDSLAVDIRITTGCESRLIIPASIQMLVENAIKHNINTASSPLVISVEVADTGVMVANNLQPRPNSRGTGVGIANLRSQYALHGKRISVTQSETMFAVSIPFLEGR